jgi:hypothetical protein
MPNASDMAMACCRRGRIVWGERKVERKKIKRDSRDRRALPGFVFSLEVIGRSSKRESSESRVKMLISLCRTRDGSFG